MEYNESSPNEKYKFTEKERDKESNFDYFGARYYDSEIGRWLSVDPLADKYPGWSPYNYVLNNPLKYIDPNGKWVDPFSLSAGAATAVAVGIGITAAATIQATSNALSSGRLPTNLEIQLTAVKMAFDVANDVVELFSSGTEGTTPDGGGSTALGGESTKKKPEQAGVSASGQPIDKHGNKIGPSGELQVDKVKHSTKKRARDAARGSGKRKPVNHPSPKKGDPHYHPEDKNGNKIPSSTHHEYPR